MDGNDVAIILPNSDTPELVDAIINHLELNTKVLYDLIVINNGNEGLNWNNFLCDCLNYDTSLGMGTAVLSGLDYAENKRKIAGRSSYSYYWILTTSVEFLQEKDYLRKMLDDMTDDVVMVSPAIFGTAWDSLNKVGSSTRKVWGVDNNAVLICAEWFNRVGRYSSELTYGWGSSLEACWKARRDGKFILVDDSLEMKKHDGIAHQMGRRPVSRCQFNERAAKEMNVFFQEKYGKDFINRLRNEFYRA